MLQGNSIGNWENIREKYPGRPNRQFLELWKMPGGWKPYRARTLGYSPGLELALNICPWEGIALAA
jgi:hypothetical protein